MKPFRCYFLGTLGIFLFVIVYTGNLTITVFEMIIQSLGSIKLLFLQFLQFSIDDFSVEVNRGGEKDSGLLSLT